MNVYGYVNGKAVYSHDEFAFEARGFGAIESDEELLSYAEKVTSGWFDAGWHRTFATYFLSTLDRLHGVLSLGEWDRLVELQKEAQRAEKAADDARGWEYVTTTYYADNSVEETWRDKDGIEKYVMLVGPHGDAC